MRVVIIDEELPYPPNSGKRIRTLNLLLPLARRHQITYLCYPGSDAEQTRRAVEFFRGKGIESVLVDRLLPHKGGAAFYGRLLWNLFSPLPYSVQTHNSAALRRAIRLHAAAHEVDLWHCEWTPYGESLGPLASRRCVVMAHNVESMIWQRYYVNETNRLKRWYIRRQWKKFERFERRMFTAALRTVAVSESDARLIRTQFGADRVDVVDNGVDVKYFRPNGAVRDPNNLLFLGSLDWRPNLDAVGLLLDRIFPRVRAEIPAARLMIVGRKPSPRLAERVRSCPGAELHADVDDVRPFLHRCGLMVVPLRIGGGSRLKILEALAAECPVVSTRVGAEGLRLEPGKDFVQVEDVDDVAAALTEHINHPRAIGEMARCGRQVVVQQYDWSRLSARLETIWQAQEQAAGGRR
ncbi:MAG: glycosyltransferase [Pirellulales bacterium]|nr:glycosyltransferase [Pirellulales bacterium]